MLQIQYSRKIKLYNKHCKTKKLVKGTVLVPSRTESIFTAAVRKKSLAQKLFYTTSGQLAGVRGRDSAFIEEGCSLQVEESMAVGIVANLPCKSFNCLICSVILTPLCLETHRVILLSVFSKGKRYSGCAKSSLTQAVRSKSPRC